MNFCQVAAAKEIAEENDKKVIGKDFLFHFNSFFWKKVEEVVRKNMLAELNRDRAEAKADRNDAKIQSE